MDTYGGVEVHAHVSMTLAQVGGEWSASRFSRFTPRYPFERGLGVPQKRSGRRNEEKNLASTGILTATPGWPARSHSLYLLRYHG
jgi:hypothetical protein